MAEIRAFRGLRYDLATADPAAVTCPPYDVIGPADRAALVAQEPRNAVRIELPVAEPAEPDPYRAAARLFQAWRADGTLRLENEAAVYIHRHQYSLDGVDQERTGVMVAARLEDAGARAILPHERTLAHDRRDRTELIRALQANTSPVWGVFDDSGTAWADRISRICAVPPTVRFDQGAERHSLWVVTEPDSIAELAAAPAARSIVIADGNHRYGVALAHRDEVRAGKAGTQPGAEAVMMLLTGTSDPGLRILPTHRVLPSEGRRVTHEDLRRTLASTMTLTAAGAEAQPGAIVAVSAEGAVCLRPREAGKPDQLDVETLQDAILGPVFGLDRAAVESGALRYLRDWAEAVAEVREGRAGWAFLVSPVPLEVFLRRAESGELMPQKTTYFWPKPPTGLVFRTLDLPF